MPCRQVAALTLTLSLLAATGSAGPLQLRDGRRFDSGAEMTARAEGAPEALDRMAFFRGQWEVERRIFENDGAEHAASCRAEVTWFNRGHGLMEKLHCPDFDGEGNERTCLGFLVFNPANELWLWGEVDSFTESARVLHGGFEGERLVLRTAIRRGGGPLLTHYRSGFEETTDGGLRRVTERSVDDGRTWSKSSVSTYRRMQPKPDLLAPAGDFGAPAPGLPPEARQFDFLIGTWRSKHDLTFPSGQQVRWTSNSTAVYALNGHAVMEFDWFDQDPRLPDAATSIVRIYNRAMRRWESLYLPNRGHGILHFGGRKEGDRMVLHPFEVHTADRAIQRYVFHDLGGDRYGWFNEQSTDRGATFKKSWIIEVERVAELESAEGSAGPRAATRDPGPSDQSDHR